MIGPVAYAFEMIDIFMFNISIKGCESSSQFRWFTIAKIEL